MMWVVGGALLVLGLVSGFVFGHKVSVHNLTPAVFRLERASAIDRQLILSLLRRPIANCLIRRDPDRFLRVYKEEFAFTNAVSSLPAEKRSFMLKELTDEFPYFQDFDILAVRDYVLTADALTGYTADELENHFKKLVRFQALTATFDTHWNSDFPISAGDVEFAEKYVSQIKDTFFKKRLVAALAEYRADGGHSEKFVRDAYTVQPVPHFAEIRYGIHLKDTDEYGLYGSFTADNDKHYQRFYRSDATFKHERYIDEILLDEKLS